MYPSPVATTVPYAIPVSPVPSVYANQNYGIYNLPPSRMEDDVKIDIPIKNYQPSYAPLNAPSPQYKPNHQSTPISRSASLPTSIPSSSPTYGVSPIQNQPIPLPTISYPPGNIQPYNESPQTIPETSYPRSTFHNSTSPSFHDTYSYNQPKSYSSRSKIMDEEQAVIWTIPYEEGVSSFVSHDGASLAGVKKISFKNMQIGDNGCDMLCRYIVINRFTELKKINLTNCSLTDNSLNSILSLMRTNPLPKLKEINISENSFADSSIAVLTSFALNKIEIIHEQMKDTYPLVKPPPLASQTPLLHGPLSYQVHVEDHGWLSVTQENQIAGFPGKKKKIECIRVFYTGPGEIQLMGHVQDIGWMKQVQANQDCGTTGQSKRLEAIRVWFTGISGLYLEYRVYVEKKGWQKWCRDGAIAGTTGQGKRIEAIQFRFI